MYFFVFFLLTTDCVLQSWPLIVKSNLKRSLLMTSMLQVSDLPSAYILPLNGLLVLTCTAILVSLQFTDTAQNLQYQNIWYYNFSLRICKVSFLFFFFILHLDFETCCYCFKIYWSFYFVFNANKFLHVTAVLLQTQWMLCYNNQCC